MKTPLKTPLKTWQVALLLSLALAGCGELNTPGDPLVLFASTVDPAYLSEDYTFDFVVSGGLAPYNFELRDGKVPPGLTLENGSLSGTPTRAGSYTFTLQVSDASLSRTEEDFTVEVTEAPPAELVLNVPPTTIADAVRIPISVQEARNLQALRTQITWDDTLFEFVGGSVRSAQSSLALLQQAKPGQLNVDAAFLGPSLNGDAELFSFELRPTEPNTLSLEARTEYRTRDGTHGFSSTQDSATPTDIPTDTSGNTLDNQTGTDLNGTGSSDGSSDNTSTEGDTNP